MGWSDEEDTMSEKEEEANPGHVEENTMRESNLATQMVKKLMGACAHAKVLATEKGMAAERSSPLTRDEVLAFLNRVAGMMDYAYVIAPREDVGDVSGEEDLPDEVTLGMKTETGRCRDLLTFVFEDNQLVDVGLFDQEWW